MKMFFCKLSDCFFYNYKYEQSYKNISSNRNTTLSITISRLIPQYRKLDFRNKKLFYQIIHQNDEPKSYVLFYNILEDFNFGTIHYFWNNVWLEIILKSNIIQDKAHLQQKILSANLVKMSENFWTLVRVYICVWILQTAFCTFSSEIDLSFCVKYSYAFYVLQKIHYLHM